MTPEERRQKMVELLESREYCTVEYFTQYLCVSPMTVRRDLAVLENEGRALRCHGGAGAAKFNDYIAPTFVAREYHRVEDKKKIAMYAIEKLKSGTAVYIDSSSTAFVFAKLIEPEHGVTVVTNSLRVATELSRKHVPVYCTGGRFHAAEQAFFGELAESTLERFRFSAAFLSPRGIMPSDGAYDCTEHEMHIHKICIRCAEEAYYLCTDGKYGNRFRYRVCDISAFREIITLQGCFSSLDDINAVLTHKQEK